MPAARPTSRTCEGQSYSLRLVSVVISIRQEHSYAQISKWQPLASDTNMRRQSALDRHAFHRIPALQAVEASDSLDSSGSSESHTTLNRIALGCDVSVESLNVQYCVPPDKLQSLYTSKATSELLIQYCSSHDCDCVAHFLQEAHKVTRAGKIARCWHWACRMSFCTRCCFSHQHRQIHNKELNILRIF